MWKRAVLGSALSLAISVSAAQAETINWKMQSLMPAGSTANKVFEDFTKNVDAMSGGRLKIEVMPVDSVVAADQTLEAIGQGILDGHFGSPGYFAGEDPAFGVLGSFMAGYDTPLQFQMFYEYGGGTEIARELYQDYNVHFVGPSFWQAESIPARKPIRSAEDFKGVKIRAPGGVVGQVFSALDASVVSLPGSEIFQALSTGVIDATDYSTLGQNAQVGLYQTAKYSLYPGISSMPACDISVNLDRWNELPDDLKAIVETATRQFAADMNAQTLIDDQKAAKSVVADEGVELIDWSPEERQKLRGIAAEAVKEYAEGSEFAKKAYEAHIAFMQQIGLL
ncbi:TRAP transporter substrate-binding protein [Geminicoccus roseus]|uniref:TRAP transporter substrate-binding protein n=1 Tax=Geminicoccus roseus TaxID=404900 RepID=UPI0004226F5F|nr:TRAP transporter substrate-binding protein [Geminicoccus roseus]